MLLKLLKLCLFTTLLYSTLVTSLQDGICVLYANDDTRSFYFSGVTVSGALNPQLLDFSNWDSVRCGLDSGENEDTIYIIPEGVGKNPNMTIATVHTQTNGTATISYSVLGQVPGFEGVAPYTFMPVVHLDKKRNQMIAALEGQSGPSQLLSPPASPLRDPGDLFLVIADVFPSNGTVSKVWLDLSEEDLRWGTASLSGVSAFDGYSFWLNPVGGNTPSEQALYGFPINGTATTAVPYGNQLNLAHLFFSAAQSSLLAVLDNGDAHSTLARFSPPSPEFIPIFSWNLTSNEQDYGLYDVSPDESKLLSVIVDKNGEGPILVIVDLVTLKEIQRIPIKDFQNSDTLVDVNWCNVK
jgi:hypothetical protein